MIIAVESAELRLSKSWSIIIYIISYHYRPIVMIEPSMKLMIDDIVLPQF